jgi:hypothetical protein
MQGEWTPEREFVEAFEAWEAVTAPSCAYTTQRNPKACKGGTTPSPHTHSQNENFETSSFIWFGPNNCFIGLALVGKDIIVFRFIVEYSSLRDFYRPLGK